MGGAAEVLVVRDRLRPSGASARRLPPGVLETTERPGAVARGRASVEAAAEALGVADGRAGRVARRRASDLPTDLLAAWERGVARGLAERREARRRRLARRSRCRGDGTGGSRAA